MNRRLTDREVQLLLLHPDVQKAMSLRCEEEGHDWQEGITITFQRSQVCGWCGARR